MIAKKPVNEKSRIKELLSLNILDTLSEAEFENITLLASTICQAPISAISLIDHDRQWFKSHLGLQASETPRDIAFCSHAILEDEIFTVEDALKDVRFSENPLVVSNPKIRFYAGAPLRMQSGEAMGTLCVIDTIPKRLNEHQKLALSALAQNTVNLLEARKLKNNYDLIIAALKNQLDQTKAAAVLFTHTGEILMINSLFHEFFGSSLRLNQAEIKNELEKYFEPNDQFVAQSSLLKNQALMLGELWTLRKK